MKRSTKASAAREFNRLDFHDDSLVSVRINPPRSRRNFAQIEFEFKEYATGSRKILLFRGCANLRFVADFDVLADNWNIGNTKASAAHVDVERMARFVNAMQAHWRTTYMPPFPRNKPIRKKLRGIRSNILFRLAFFGGTAEILAGSHKLKRYPNPGEMVVLIEIPQGMLDDLPRGDQRAITDVVGKPVRLNEYDDAGRAELEFKDRNGHLHFLWVDSRFIKAAYQ